MTSRDPMAPGSGRCPQCGAPSRGDARFCGVCGAATASTEPASSPNLGPAPTMVGREIAGRYRVLAKLGEGGMGAVFRAEQISLKRTVAVKLLRPDVSADPMLLRRFNAEAEVVAKLSHPNTVNIYDFGQDSDGTLFIAMELIDGRSLRSVLQREAPLALPRALSIASQIAASLTDAHGHGIVHRDLKPDNVMLSDRGRERDVVRVLDFGIAKLRDDTRATQAAMTQQGDMLGTPQYMSPEQIRAEPIDGRTDIYALGCLLYEMVTGRLPHDATTVLAMLSKHLLEIPVAPTQRRPDLGLPPAIDGLILGAMAKDPRARPPTMEAYGEQIAALRHGLSDPRTAQRPAVPTGSNVAHVATPPPGRADAPAPPSLYGAPTPAAPSLYGAPTPGTPSLYGAPTPGTPVPLSSAYAAPGALSPSGVPSPYAPPGASGRADAPPPHSPVPPGMAYPPPHASPQPWQDAPGTVVVRRPGRLGLALAVGGVLVAGITVAAVLLGRDGGPPKPDNRTALVTPPADERAGPDAGAAGGSGTKVPPAADPWADSPSSRPPGSSPPARYDVPLAAGRKVAVGQGVSIVAPPGFQVRSQNGVTAAFDNRGVAIVAWPITDDSDDPRELAEDYADSAHLTLDGMGTAFVGGVQRQMAMLHGRVQGVDVRQFGVALIGSSYRIAVIFSVPVKFATDPAIQRLMLELWPRRIALP